MPQSKQLASMWNMHKGDSCIIVGNGPSLNNVPLKFLEEHITFGTNKIYMLDGFVPTFYVSVNPLVIHQSWEHIKAMHTTKFLREGIYSSNNFISLHSMAAPMFSYDPSRYVYEGHTVTFVCMQLAFFFGFQKIGLVGVDHRFEYAGEPNEARVHHGPDTNHFHEDYFRDQEWNNPDLERSEQAYSMALEAFKNDGREIVNLTEGTALEVFPKMELSEWTKS